MIGFKLSAAEGGQKPWLTESPGYGLGERPPPVVQSRRPTVGPHQHHLRYPSSGSTHEPTGRASPPAFVTLVPSDLLSSPGKILGSPFPLKLLFRRQFRESRSPPCLTAAAAKAWSSGPSTKAAPAPAKWTATSWARRNCRRSLRGLTSSLRQLPEQARLDFSWRTALAGAH